MTLRELVDGDKVSFGGWCSTPSPLIAELVGHAGFDWVCVDSQHGVVGPETLMAMLQAIDLSGRPSVVRVPWNDPSAIMKSLDAGAQGIIVPMVNSPEEAARAVSACRYPPDGIRSWGLNRRAFDGSYTTERGNHATVCAIQIETLRGLDAAREILAVPGIDIAYVGPADLAVSAGIAPTFDVESSRHEKLITDLLDACLEMGVVPGIHAPLVKAALRWRDAGFRFITAASDIGYILQGARATLGALHA